MFQSECEHRFNIYLVARGHYYHVWKDSEVGKVIDAVMRRAVRTNQASTIKTEHNRQVLKG